jgi:outer membrane biosynthesis protein TonB
MKFITTAFVTVLLLNFGQSVSLAQSNSNNSNRTAQENKAEGKGVARKVKLKSRPEPDYPKEARKESDYPLSVMVRLRMVLAATAQVTNIEVVQVIISDTVSDKVRESFIRESVKAASKIKFEPAEKDGKKVSQYVTIDYNFNILYKP